MNQLALTTDEQDELENMDSKQPLPITVQRPFQPIPDMSIDTPSPVLYSSNPSEFEPQDELAMYAPQNRYDANEDPLIPNAKKLYNLNLNMPASPAPSEHMYSTTPAEFEQQVNPYSSMTTNQPTTSEKENNTPVKQTLPNQSTTTNEKTTTNQSTDQPPSNPTFQVASLDVDTKTEEKNESPIPALSAPTMNFISPDISNRQKKAHQDLAKVNIEKADAVTKTLDDPKNGLDAIHQEYQNELNIAKDKRQQIENSRQDVEKKIDNLSNSEYQGFWADKGTGYKITSILAVTMGALGANYTNGKNLAWEMIQKTMDDDRKRWQDNLRLKLEVLDRNKVSLDDRQRFLDKALEDAQARNVARLNHVKAKAEQLAQRFESKTINPNLALVMANIDKEREAENQRIAMHNQSQQLEVNKYLAELENKRKDREATLLANTERNKSYRNDENIRTIYNRFNSDPEIKAYNQLSAMFERVKAAPQTGEGDRLLITDIVKMGDISSVVSINEALMVENGGATSIEQLMKIVDKKAVSGRVLSPKQRKNYIDAIRQKMQAYQQNHILPKVNIYKSQMQKAKTGENGLDIELVDHDYSDTKTDSNVAPTKHESLQELAEKTEKRKASLEQLKDNPENYKLIKKQIEVNEAYLQKNNYVSETQLSKLVDETNFFKQNLESYKNDKNYEKIKNQISKNEKLIAQYKPSDNSNMSEVKWKTEKLKQALAANQLSPDQAEKARKYILVNERYIQEQEARQ